MRLFALDSSIEANFSIAILDSNETSKNQIIFQENYNNNYNNYYYNNNGNKANNKVKFTESFFPSIEAKPALIENIDYFIINRGPGSYTGIRAGSAALAGLSIGKQSAFLGVNSFILMAYKFFQASCETKSLSINSKKAHVFLKSYQEEYFYYQAVEFINNDNDYNLLEQPRKISIYEILEDPTKYYPLITNLTDDIPLGLSPAYREQYSALDLALFIQEQLLINNKSGLKFLKYKETYPIYIQ